VASPAVGVAFDPTLHAEAATHVINKPVVIANGARRRREPR